MKRIVLCSLLCLGLVHTVLALDAIEFFSGYMNADLKSQHFIKENIALSIGYVILLIVVLINRIME
ncbi:MAG: hypothetical protein KAJ14_00885 [Candidatus Omnitrophica bacterium]|nr:hypothetical protein [Candidatus Omnitrophota bacterium]